MIELSVTSVGDLPRNPTVYNVTMTNADTEYSQQLSKYTTRFMIKTRDNSEFRLAFVTGKVATPVAPYLTVNSGLHLWEDAVDVYIANADWNGTMYFASASAGKIIEILEWV